MAPFIFNPYGFDWLKTVYDFDDFMNWIWIRGGVVVRRTGSSKNDRSLGEVIRDRFGFTVFLFPVRIVCQLGIAANNKSIAAYLLSSINVAVVV